MHLTRFNTSDHPTAPDKYNIQTARDLNRLRKRMPEFEGADAQT